MHLSACRYAEAQFCLEECVLLAPFNAKYHTELGEIMLEAAANPADACHNFALAVKLTDGKSARALAGLAAATRTPEGSLKVSVVDAAGGLRMKGLRTVAVDGLRAVYDAAGAQALLATMLP